MSRLDTARTSAEDLARVERRLAALERNRAATTFSSFVAAANGFPATPVHLIEHYGAGRFSIQPIKKSVIAFTGAPSASFWCWLASDGTGLEASILHDATGRTLATATPMESSDIFGETYIAEFFEDNVLQNATSLTETTIVLSVSSSGTASYVQLIASGWGTRSV